MGVHVKIMNLFKMFSSKMSAVRLSDSSFVHLSVCISVSLSICKKWNYAFISIRVYVKIMILNVK